MDFVVRNGLGMRVRECSEQELKALHGVRLDIIRILAGGTAYPAEIAKRTGLNEQLTHYHIQKLLHAGIIEVVKKEEMRGAVAKYLSLTAPAFAFIAGKTWTPFASAKTPPRIFEQLVSVENVLVVGSPDPHGPAKARARDAHFAIELAQFLGSAGISTVAKLDTEIKAEDLGKNLVCVGGPITNLVTARFVEKTGLSFVQKQKKWVIHSSFSGKDYGERTHGLIAQLKNPRNVKTTVTILAGNEVLGTRAAVLAVTRHSEMSFQNRHDKKRIARVVEGVDADGDGVIDDAEVLE